MNYVKQTGQIHMNEFNKISIYVSETMNEHGLK